MFTEHYESRQRYEWEQRTGRRGIKMHILLLEQKLWDIRQFGEKRIGLEF